ncbi:MAG: hypothetical protein ACYCVM_09715 [Acidiferrobacter sp.]
MKRATASSSHCGGSRAAQDDRVRPIGTARYGSFSEHSCRKIFFDHELSDLGEQGLAVPGELGTRGAFAKEGRGLVDQLPTPLDYLIGMDLMFGNDLVDIVGRLAYRFFSCKASKATLALNRGAWIRRILLIVFPLLSRYFRRRISA